MSYLSFEESWTAGEEVRLLPRREPLFVCPAKDSGRETFAGECGYGDVIGTRSRELLPHPGELVNVLDVRLVRSALLLRSDCLWPSRGLDLAISTPMKGPII